MKDTCKECRSRQQARRVQRQRNLDMTAGKPVLVDCCVVLLPGHGCSYLFYFWFVTSVHLNTAQVTNMAQLHCLACAFTCGSLGSWS